MPPKSQYPQDKVFWENVVKKYSNSFEAGRELNLNPRTIREYLQRFDLRFGEESKLAGKTVEEIAGLIKATGGVYATARLFGVSHAAIYDKLNMAGITPRDIMQEYQGEIAPPVIDNDTLTGNYILSADFHSPFTSLLWLDRIGEVAQREGIKQLLVAGDLFDFDRLSWWLRQSQAEDIAVKLEDELAFTEMVLEKLNGWFDRIDIVGGNHWLTLVSEWLRFCDAILIAKMPPWKESGVERELKMAEALGLIVYHNLWEIPDTKEH